jgi:hypothetical protein
MMHPYLSTYFALETDLGLAKLVRIEKTLSEPPVKLSGIGNLALGVQRAERVMKDALKMDKTTDIAIVKCVNGTRFIEYECVRYFYTAARNQFISVKPSVGETFHQMTSNPGLSSNQAAEILARRGPNAVAFPGDTFASGLVAEFSGYFYIYQLMSLWVWFYYAYVSSLTLLLAIGLWDSP